MNLHQFGLAANNHPQNTAPREKLNSTPTSCGDEMASLEERPTSH
nr:hypothetical protein Iba_chr02bCG7930 [Ipomoea batatas]